MRHKYRKLSTPVLDGQDVSPEEIEEQLVVAHKIAEKRKEACVTLSGHPVTEPLGPAPEEQPGREQVEGVCAGIAYINPRIIGVDVPGVGRICVFVRDPKNFIKGMAVRAYRDIHPGTPSQWFLNSPLPRFRGRY